MGYPMRNAFTSKSHAKSTWMALLLGGALAALTAQSCSIDKSQYTFSDEAFDAGMNSNG